jgi:hypothetical protein
MFALLYLFLMPSLLPWTTSGQDLVLRENLKGQRSGMKSNVEKPITHADQQ